MGLAAWLLAVAAAVAVYRYAWSMLAWIRARRRVYELMAKIPGPKALPLIGTTYQFKTDRTDFSYQLTEWDNLYGKIGGLMAFWIGTKPMVVITKAHTAEVELYFSIDSIY